MTLRELINRLEKLSHDGKYDDCLVETWSETDGFVADGNEMGYGVISACINEYVMEDIKTTYIQIVTD